MEFSARRRGEIHEGFKSFLPASMDCAPRELERPFRQAFSPLWSYSRGAWADVSVRDLYVIGHAFGVRVDGATPRGLWPPVGGRLCRRVAEKGS